MVTVQVGLCILVISQEKIPGSRGLQFVCVWVGGKAVVLPEKLPSGLPGPVTFPSSCGGAAIICFASEAEM